MHSILKAGFPFVPFVALILSIILVMMGQKTQFSELRETGPLACEKVPVSLISNLDSDKVIQCHTDFVLSLTDRFAINRVTEQSDDFAILIPYFRDSLTVNLNGKFVGQVGLNEWQMPSRLSRTPALLDLPATNIRPGRNRLEIIIRGLAGREPNVGPLYIGREKAAADQFWRLNFLAEGLPNLTLGGEAALSLLFFAMWRRRRQETAFGWFALVIFLDTLRGLTFLPAFGGWTSNVSYWSLLVPFSSAAYLMFTRELVKLPFAKWIALAWVAPALVAGVAAFSTAAFATNVLLPLGVSIIFINLLWSVAVLVMGWQSGVREASLLLYCTILFVALVFHDVLLNLNVIGGHVAVARPGLLVLLIAVAGILVTRFTSAMTELDLAAETLRSRAAQIEKKLRLADEQLRAQRESTILAQERARLMRDLHDGLGGEMVAVLALAERDQSQKHEIAYHARAALVDMRLIIASMEDYGGDFAMALGAWKERAEPQIRAAGMILHWEIKQRGTSITLSATRTLEIMRIFQEALTNAIRHSEASNITVASSLTNDHLVLSFVDDGKGIDTGIGSGKGIANMFNRAAALGGDLSVEADHPGTAIVLRLPINSVQH